MKDLLLDDDFDLKIVNGDFVIGDSDEQNVLLHAFTEAGQWVNEPLLGVGIGAMINGSPAELQRIKSLLAESIKQDGYSLEDLIVDSNGKLVIKFK